MWPILFISGLNPFCCLLFPFCISIHNDTKNKKKYICFVSMGGQANAHTANWMQTTIFRGYIIFWLMGDEREWAILKYSGNVVRLDARFLPSSNRQRKTDKQIEAIVVEWGKRWKTKTHHHKYTFVQIQKHAAILPDTIRLIPFALLRHSFRCMCVCVCSRWHCCCCAIYRRF